MGSLPKSKKKNIPKNINEMSQEMLQETLKKKKECNAKALRIVEKLCETHIHENWFMENLQFINQCHFDDVTIERSISKICGYPLCDQQLKNVPAQQYHISVKYNKVFDITERKNFCSSCCYKSAMHVKKQLFTSPLWFRDQEIIPKYTLLRSTESCGGEEFVLSTNEIKPEPQNMMHTKVLNKIESENKHIMELGKRYSHLDIDNSQKVIPEKASMKIDADISLLGEKVTLVGDLSEGYSTGKEEMRGENESNKRLNGEDDCQKDKISRNHQVLNPKKINKPRKNEGKPVDTIMKVEKSIFEWFSLHTLFYLYGEEKLKELFCDKADEIKQVLNSKLSKAGMTDKIDRMIQLYGLLDTDLLSRRESKMNLKPLPDYSILKKEKDTVEIKVKAFYQGQLEVKQPPTEEKENGEKETNTDSEVLYLPLIDAHAQMPLRRKILLEKLNRVIPDLIRVFSLDYTLQMNEVRNLVTTFTLGAHNIIFKPYEWYLVGLIIIKLLCIKDKQLESAIKLESSENQILLILTNYKLQKDYLDNLVIRLTDSKNLMKKINEIND